MKNRFIRWSLLFSLFFPMFASGQGDTNWVQLMSDPTANFYDAQAAFNNYWKDRPIEKGKGYKQFKRWENYMEPRVYPSGDMTLPSLTYPNYLEWLSQQPDEPSPAPNGFTLGNWTALGPFGVSNGGGAGRINFVRFDPTNSNTIFVGAPDGGLWKSTNGGTSWTTATDQLTVIGCTDVAIDPTNTQVMYLATGDGEAGDCYSVGVLKSTDGGATWNTTGLNWTVNQGRTISKLLMHPTNSQILIAATSNGIYRTVDGGVNWTQTSTGSFKDLEFVPGTPNTVYTSGTIFRKSTDNGVTWTTITSGLPTTGIERIAIAVTAADPTYVYLLIGRSSDQGLQGVYRSTNTGTSFTTQKGPTNPNLLGWNSNGADGGGQAFYDLSIQASPTAANTVIVGGVNTWRSTDGGVNWTINSHWTGSGAPYVHADIHAIEYLPGSGTTYFIGHDGGISKTTNSGTSFTDISGNLAIAQQYRIGLSTTTAGRMITGHQDNGTNLLNGGVWNEVYGGDGMDCFIDRTNNNTLYGSYVYGDYYKSTNGGAGWTTITTGLPGGDWLCAWHQDPVTAATLYAGGRTAMYRTNNGGTNWSALGTPSGSGSILEFVIAPSNNQIIYSVKTNAVSKSTNGGTSWTNVTGTLPVASASLTNVTVSNTDPNIVWVTFSGYSAANKVFKSTNGGTSWTNVTTGLPNVPCNTIVYQNAAANDVVYVGTDIGVFYRDNTMGSWVAYMDGLPRVSVRDLEIYYLTGKIRAATFGRGTWESNVATPGANAPVADFIGAPLQICAGSTVTFTDQSAFTPTSWSWSFPGGTPSTSTAQNPTITYSTAGVYDVTLTATNANGSDPEVKTGYITVVGGTGVALPLTEGFTAATFVPAGWSLVNTNVSTSWVRDATIGYTPTTGNSMMFDNFNINDSDDDEVRVRAVTLASLVSAQLTFDVAYAPYDATNFDGLEVLVSTNCGASFTSLYSKSNTVLATAPATTATFTPTAAQWRTETVNLTPYVGQTNVVIAFRNLSGYGNRLFVDNINITGSAPTTAAFTASLSTVCTGQTVTVTDASIGATSWSWNFGVGATPATATGVGPHSVTYSSAGTKTIQLTINGSTSTTQNVTVNATPATPTITAGGPTTFCAGGSVVLTSSSATGNLWSTGATTQSITVSTSGTYTVSVTTGGCTSASSAGTTITVNPLPATPTISAGGPTTFCAGGSVVLTSSSATGNTWSTGATTQSITVSTAGTYTVTVNSGGCNSAASAGTAVTVNALPSAPTITAGGPLTFCAGGSVVLTSSSATGNTWSTGATTQSITVSTSGTYTVTRTTGGCTSVASAGTTVTVNALPATPTISAGGTLTFCAGGNVVLTSSSATGNLWSTGATTQSITVSTSGTYTVNVTSGGCTSANSAGTTVTVTPLPATPTISAGGPTTFCAGGSVVLTSSSATGNLWSTGATTQSITVSTAGTYTVSVTSGGCTSATSAGTTVTVNPLPTTPTISAGGPTTFCAGGSVVLTSSSATGNTWSTGATTQSITVSASGTYTVTVTSGGCTSVASAGTTVTVTPLPTTPTISAGGPLTFCAGGSVVLTSSSATGNTWSTGATTQSITVTTAGTYTVNVTSSGCTSANSAGTAVVVNALPVIASGTVVNPTSCGTSTGSIQITGSGTGTINWTGTSSGTLNSVTLPTTINSLAAGSYSITFTNASGCVSNTVSQGLNDPTPPTTPTISAGGPTTFCSGGSVVLTSSSATGNTWSTGATTQSITVSTGGSYAVTFTNVSGCSATSLATVVTVNPTPTISLGTITNPSACGTSTGIIQLNGSGTGTLSWSGSASGSMNSITLPASITGLAAGSYTIVFNSSAGCASNSLSQVLTDPTPPPSPTISAGGATTFCVGDSVVLTSSSATGNTWSNGAITQSTTIVTSGNYTVTFTDISGCSATSGQTSVTVNPLPTVTFGLLADMCDYNSAITLTQGSPAGGTYSGNGVSGGSFDPSASGLGVSTLTYDFTDANGCSSTATSDVFVGDCASLNETVVSTIDIFPNPSSGIVTVDPNGAAISAVVVFDYSGRLVYQNRKIGSVEPQIVDLSGLAVGVYNVRVITGTSVVNTPVVINH
ncbi:MAG: PKD domain-containing protein [Fluviicola sp.]|nr:PKD domain-containing protein [Fluviicola sp.]